MLYVYAYSIQYSYTVRTLYIDIDTYVVQPYRYVIMYCLSPDERDRPEQGVLTGYRDRRLIRGGLARLD